MSNLRMKRFDAMQSSKRSIIEKTNAQLQSGHVKKRRSSNVFYFIGLAVVTCIVSIGLYYLLLKDTTPVQQAAPIPSIDPNEQPKEEIIKMSVIADGRIIIRGEQFYFQVDDYTIKTVPILKEYVSAETLLLIDERFHEEIQQAFSPQIKENASINATFTINDLRKLDGGAYKIEQLEIVSYNSGFNSPALFTLNFDVQGKVVLTEQLLTRYEAFKGNYEREALRGLSPVEVFYLYEYAYDEKDYETAYELIMPDERYLKPDKEDFLKQSSGYGDQQRIHPFYGKNLYLTIFKSNGELKANLVTEDESQFFGLTQSEDGIWFVNFLPMQ